MLRFFKNYLKATAVKTIQSRCLPTTVGKFCIYISYNNIFNTGNAMYMCVHMATET